MEINYDGISPEDYEPDPESHSEFLGPEDTRGVWTTGSGSTIHISEMKDSHIEGCVKLLRSGRIKGEEKAIERWVEAFQTELKRRGKVGFVYPGTFLRSKSKPEHFVLYWRHNFSQNQFWGVVMTGYHKGFDASDVQLGEVKKMMKHDYVLSSYEEYLAFIKEKYR